MCLMHRGSKVKKKAVAIKIAALKIKELYLMCIFSVHLANIYYTRGKIFSIKVNYMYSMDGPGKSAEAKQG